MGDGDLIVSRTAKLAPTAVIQIGTTIDNGSAVTEGGPGFSAPVSLSLLMDALGADFNMAVMAEVTRIQAQIDAQEKPPAPNRSARRARASSNGKVSP